MFYIGILTMMSGACVSFWGICFGAVDYGNTPAQLFDLGIMAVGFLLIAGGLSLCEEFASRGIR